MNENKNQLKDFYSAPYYTENGCLCYLPVGRQDSPGIMLCNFAPRIVREVIVGNATGMSKNTVRKYVESLERKGFIRTEPTKVITRDGRVHNGSLLYTIQPIRPIEDAYFEQQIA